jgi:hypothetical protein
MGYYSNSARHYQLNFDVDSLATAIRALTAISAFCYEKSKSSKGYPARIGNSWHGKTATAVKEEMTGWGTIMDKCYDQLFRYRHGDSEF